jgi:hypothetical protein
MSDGRSRARTLPTHPRANASSPASMVPYPAPPACREMPWHSGQVRRQTVNAALRNHRRIVARCSSLGIESSRNGHHYRGCIGTARLFCPALHTSLPSPTASPSHWSANAAEYPAAAPRLSAAPLWVSCEAHGARQTVRETKKNPKFVVCSHVEETLMVTVYFASQPFLISALKSL